MFSFFISMLFSFISDFNQGPFNVSWVYFTIEVSVVVSNEDERPSSEYVWTGRVSRRLGRRCERRLECRRINGKSRISLPMEAVVSV